MYLLEVFEKLAVILGSVGTLAALSWAVFAHFRGIRQDKTAQFRASLHQVPSHYGEMSYKYETYAIQFIKCIFDPTNTGYERFDGMIRHCFTHSDKEECREYLDEHATFINRYISFALPMDLVDLSMSKRVETESAMAPVAHFSKVTHMFLRSSSDLIFVMYREKFGVDVIHHHLKGSILTEWELINQTGMQGQVDAEQTVKLTRERLFLTMIHYNANHTIPAMFAMIDNVVRNYVDFLTRQSDATLWKVHQTGLKAPESILGEKSTETMQRALVYEGNELGVDLSPLVKLIMELEAVFDEPNF